MARAKHPQEDRLWSSERGRCLPEEHRVSRDVACGIPARRGQGSGSQGWQGDSLPDHQDSWSSSPSGIEGDLSSTLAHGTSEPTTFVEVNVVDKDGNLCPNATNQVFFSVEKSPSAASAPVILGTDNGCQTSLERFTDLIARHSSANVWWSSKARAPSSSSRGPHICLTRFVIHSYKISVSIVPETEIFWFI